MVLGACAAQVPITPGGLEEPAYRPAPPPPPPAPRECGWSVPVVPLESKIGQLPEASQDDSLDSALQFLNSVSISVETVDRHSATIVTKPITGQTIISDCGANLYRVYVAHISVIGRSLSVTLECHGASGWEAHMIGSTMIAAHREPITPCDTVSAGDAAIPQQFIDGTAGVLELKAAQHR